MQMSKGYIAPLLNFFTKERNMQLTALLTDIQALKLRHKQAPEASLEHDLTHLHCQVSELLRYCAKAAIQACRRLHYESSDKCGKQLARALQDQRVAFYIL